MTDFLLFFLLFLYTLVCSYFFTQHVLGYLSKNAVVDIPNDRSSHTQPTLRGGGLAVTAVLSAGVLVLIPFVGKVENVWLFLSLGLLFYMSWRDDKEGLSVEIRLPGHFIAVCLGIASLPGASLTFGGLLPLWAGLPIIVLGWVWFLNLYNFMDGIDGITSAESLSIAFGVIVLMLLSKVSMPFEMGVALVVMAAVLGFVKYNWHPAKLFLGDSGSVPLGFLLGYLLLSLVQYPFFIAAVCILPLYYFADSGITILKRLCRREKIWLPHKQHYYQQAVKVVHRHDVVVWLIIAGNGCLLALAISSLVMPLFSFMAALLVTGVVLYKLSVLTPKGS